jgi:hypothetical protein
LRCLAKSPKSAMGGWLMKIISKGHFAKSRNGGGGHALQWLHSTHQLVIANQIQHSAWGWLMPWSCTNLVCRKTTLIGSHNWWSKCSKLLRMDNALVGYLKCVRILLKPWSELLVSYEATQVWTLRWTLTFKSRSNQKPGYLLCHLSLLNVPVIKFGDDPAISHVSAGVKSTRPNCVFNFGPLVAKPRIRLQIWSVACSHQTYSPFF